MSDEGKEVTQKLYESTPPKSHQAVKFLSATTLGVTFFSLSGLTLTGTVIALIIATPILLLFSPILVPAGIVLILVASGFLFSGGCGLAAITALMWIYNYVSGKRPPGAEKIDYAKMKMVDVKERAKEYGQSVQQKAQEVTQT